MLPFWLPKSFKIVSWSRLGGHFGGLEASWSRLRDVLSHLDMFWTSFSDFEPILKLRYRPRGKIARGGVGGGGRPTCLTDLEPRREGEGGGSIHLNVGMKLSHANDPGGVGGLFPIFP